MSDGGVVATRLDFTAEEWQVLQWALSDATIYASMADPGFFDSFKELTAVARFVAAQRDFSPSTLVRDLASDLTAKRDPQLASDPTAIGDAALRRITEAVALVRAKDPGESGALRVLVLGAARAAAAASGGESVQETSALDAIAAVFDADEDPDGTR